MIQLHYILPKLFFIACFTGLTLALQAQNGNNPFELPNRPIEEAELPAAETTTDNPFEIDQSPSATPAENTTPASPNPETDTNPFEVQPLAPPPATTPPPPATTDNPFEINRISIDSDARKTVAPSPVLQPQKTKTTANNGNFRAVFATFLLVFLATLMVLYSSVIKQLYKAFLNDNMLKLKHREQGSFLHVSLIMLYFYFFLNAGFFCYLIAKHLDWEGGSDMQLLLYCILGISGAFIAKHLFLRILGAIFPIQKEIKQYNFTIVVFNIILGIILLPFNLLIAFGPESLPKYLIFSTLFIIALIYGFRIIRSLLIGSRYISLHKFHFFMYLCTVEIAPTLVLVKLLLLTKG